MQFWFQIYHQMIRKIISPLINGFFFQYQYKPISMLYSQPLEITTITIPNCLIQIVPHIGGTHGKQHIRNLNSTHGLTKASTPRINHKEMPAGSLATLSKKWLCFDINRAFQNPNITSFIHTWMR